MLKKNIKFPCGHEEEFYCANQPQLDFIIKNLVNQDCNHCESVKEYIHKNNALVAQLD